MSRRLGQNGFTLVEVIMVIIIMGILAAIAMKSLGNGLRVTRLEETKKELKNLSMAISGNPNLYTNGARTDYGYLGDVGAMPANLDNLVTNPGYSTWNGPYIKSDFTTYSDDFKKDAWGALYTYTGNNIVRSVGGGEDTLSYLLISSVSNFTANSVSGQITDALGNPPGDSSSILTVTLSYPNGAGGIKDSTLNPNASGYFSFVSTVPIGNHTITAIYSPTNDTLVSFISVPPKSDVKTYLRFPGSLWAASGAPGGGSSGLEYASGSSSVSGSGSEDIQFSIDNTSDEAKIISWITLTYSVAAYYELVQWESSSVFNSSSPRAGSGEQVSFSSSQTALPLESNIVIQINNFQSTSSGSGSDINMQNQDITVEFSDGSIITFNTGS
jgi:prepilin-type N-terminal cleavage/methylation domain-containing protein